MLRQDRGKNGLAVVEFRLPLAGRYVAVDGKRSGGNGHYHEYDNDRAGEYAPHTRKNG